MIEIKAESSTQTNIEEKSRLDIWFNDTERFLVDIVTDLAKDTSDLLMFAYELRKQDVDELHSYSILNG